MRIVPAVDIRGGRCVRLLQGDYARETVFADDPVTQARTWWETLGTGLVHIVDLDGAKAGRCQILPVLRALAEAGIAYEIGGGLRDRPAVDEVMAAGAARAILGTAAWRDPALLEALCAAYPGQIVVGIDARDGLVALSGWTESTHTQAVDFARTVAAAGAARIIYTDIARDGMMQGPNYSATAQVAEAAGIPVTLSGGISRLDDLRQARALEPSGVDEIIVGRALYEGAFSLADAVAAVRIAA